MTGQNGNYIDMPLGGVYSDFGFDHPYRFSAGPFNVNVIAMYWTSTACYPGYGIYGGRGYSIHPDVYSAYCFVANSNFGDNLTYQLKTLTYLRAMHMSIRPVIRKGL